jgi:hypothetical protein
MGDELPIAAITTMRNKARATYDWNDAHDQSIYIIAVMISSMEAITCVIQELKESFDIEPHALPSSIFIQTILRGYDDRLPLCSYLVYS